MLPKAMTAVAMALALAVPAGLAATVGLGPLKFSFHPFGGEEQESAMAALPVWKAGDTWNYTLRGSSQAPGDHARFGGNLTVKVDGIFPKSKSGLAQDVYNLTLTGDLVARQTVRVVEDPQLASVAQRPRPVTGTTVRFMDVKAIITGSAKVGTQDLSLISEHVNITGGAKSGDISLMFFVDVVNSYTPGLPLLKFPLKVDETWEQDVSLKSVSSVTVFIKDPSGMAKFSLTVDRTFVINRTAMVTAFGNATVPAGTFKAFKVVSHRADEDDREEKVNDDSHETELAESPQAAEHMGLGMIPPNGTAVGFLRFSPAEALWYSSDVRNVVAFRLHFLGPLGKTRVVGELKSFHLA